MAIADPGAETRPLRGPFPLARQALFPIVAVGLLALFLAFPAPLDDKAQAALHGLCAQRPSHSFSLGERRLPFDARMTGIYGGFLVTAIYLVGRRRYRIFRPPSLATTALLVIGVGLMGIDGLNSTLLDFRLWHPYAPSNDLRLLTGTLAGIALAVAICWLLATTLWRSGDARRRILAGPSEISLLLAIQVPFALAVRSGAAWLYVPVSLLLVLAAVAVMACLALIVLTILRRRDNTYRTLAQLDGAALTALVLGIAVMATIATGRFMLERFTGVQALP